MPEMKDSRIEWVGTVPAYWKIMSNKYIMRKVKEINPIYKGENILSLTMDGVIIRDLDAGGKMPASFDGYQKIYPNNLLMCLFDYDVTPRCIGLIKNFGVTSPAYSQFVLKDGNSSHYYYYYYLMIDHTKELLHLAKNLRHSFTEEQLGTIHTPVPPVEIQDKIADYLDSKCAEIDSLHADIEKQIDVLEQYKKSVITEAVTKGLDPNVEMKDSGIEWIGKIPNHWEVKSIRYLISDHFSGSWGSDEKKNDNDRICMRIADFDFDKMQFKVLSNDEYTIRNYNSSEIFNKSLRIGDLLIEKSGGGDKTPVGRTVVYRLPYNALFANFMDCIRLKDTYNIEFAKYVFFALYKRGVTNLYFNQTTGLQNLNMSKYFREVKLPFPKYNIQREIADYLDSKCAEIDSAIADKKKQLEILEAYKKSLIYEYVTGKKEVFA